MIIFLRKLFIKDYNNVGDKRVRGRHGVFASLCGIVFNLLLFVFKLIVGILTFSMSIISDAINNLSDLFSCFVNLIGFKMSSKPADKEHPYGHERIEYISGMIISFVIIAVAVMLGYTSVQKLISGEAETQYSLWAFVVLGAAVLMKLLLGYIYYGLGKAIDSVAIKASRRDSVNDAVSTSVVLVAAIVQYFFTNLWWLDAAMSLAVAAFILYTGIKTVRETAAPLVGTPADGKLVKSIVKDIMAYPGVMGVHDVICHAYGPTKMFMTVHVEVDGYADTFATHEIIDKIEKELGEKYGLLLTAHMDPLDTNNSEIPELKMIIASILSDINSKLTFHDLRLVTGQQNTNVIFDVVVPSDVKTPHEEIEQRVCECLREYDAKYSVVITFDEDFV